MKKSLIVFLIPTLFSSQVMTEIQVFNNSHGNVFNVKNNSFKSYEGIDGKPYINERFMPIEIEGYNRALPAVRYNAYEDEMEFMLNNTLNYVEKVNGMKFKFKDSNTIYALKNYTLDGVNKDGYLVELASKNDGFGLFRKEFVHILENSNNTTNTYLKDKNPYFGRGKDVLILSYQDNYVRFPKNASELNSYLKNTNLSSKTAEVENFVKKNKTNFKKEADLISLVNYMNTL